MRVQRHHTPLLLLLLSTLASSLSVPPPVTEDTSVTDTRDGAKKNDYGLTKPYVGTEDAPVDGLDGKPHRGPWVGNDADSKKKAAIDDDDTPAKKSEPTSLAKLRGGHSLDDSWELIPEKNDGVMDDDNRVAPKKGTTGTEGGVSEKSKTQKLQELETGEKAEKTPEQPKEAPPLPHSEQQMMQDKVAAADPKSKDKMTKDTEKPNGDIGLEKPKDLPEKPHDIPHPAPKGSDLGGDSLPPPYTSGGSDRSSKLMETMPYTEGKKPAAVPMADDESEGLIQPMHSFVLSFVMILFSEIGDKTFLVAALMAMRHDRLVVFSAAFSALITMTVLSAVLGHAVPSLLPKRFVSFAAALLFLVFGAKMLREGLQMPKDSGVGEEMKEVEAELEEKEHLARKHGRRRSSVSPYVLEAGRGRRSGSRGAATLPKLPQSPPSSDDERSPSPSKRNSVANALGGLNNLVSLVLSPAWVQTFIMTFLGEWGDRSQIATIAMAAGQDYWWVTGGAISGHGICTGIAVIGGRALAGRVSLRVVTLGGAIAFLVFGVIYLFEATYIDPASTLIID